MHHVLPNVHSSSTFCSRQMCNLSMLNWSLISILRGFRFRRKSKAAGCKRHKNPQNTCGHSPAIITETTDAEAHEEAEVVDARELPLPPSKQPMASGNFNNPNSSNNGTSMDQYIAKSASSRNFKSAISFKVPRSMSVSRTISNIRDKEKKGGSDGRKAKVGESVWTKKIILGEKCRVPGEEEDVVVRDRKGKKIATYHPRSCSLIPNYREDSSQEEGSVSSGRETT